MDTGHVYADEILDVAARLIAIQMGKANKRAVEKIRRYLEKYEAEIETMSEEMDSQEFEQWAILELTTGSEWASVRDDIADELSTATEKAIASIGILLTAVYLYNRNYMNDAIEQTLKPFRRIRLPMVKRHAPILPKSPDPKKNRIWHRRKVESVIRQGIKKGHSVDKMARRIKRVADMDTRAAYRAVRTGVTSAESQARLDAYHDAEKQGVDMVKQWDAAKDARTRTSHRMVDGEQREIDERFSNGLLAPAYPADGDPAEIYNCRCTLLGIADGHEIITIEAPEGMTRTEWIAEKPIPRHYGESKQDYLKRVAEKRARSGYSSA